MNRFILAYLLIPFAASIAISQDSSEYRQEEAVVQRGAALFETLCASCHSFDKDAIGPELGRVFHFAEKDWLFNFIKNPQAVIDSGDARAKGLLERFSGVMPSFGLSDADIEAILAYMYANRRDLRNEDVQASSKRKGLDDPIPEIVEDSSMVLELAEFAQIPASSDTLPVARINKLAGFFDGGRERLFVNDQRGLLYEIIDGEARLFWDLSKARANFVHSPGLATGFSSFAFSPEFEIDGLLYSQHAEPGDSAVADFRLPRGVKAKLQYVVTEWRVDESSRNLIEGDGRELFRIEMVDTSHGMQELAFNPQAQKGDADFGLLYIGIGDGGASYIGRPDLIAGVALPWGSVFRIDPKGRNGRNGGYGIPGDNPFVGAEGSLPEIYAHGFRNPNVLTWGPDGSLYVSDIGHWKIEELNRVVAGGDYGWPWLEGTFEIDLLGDQNQVYPRTGAFSETIDPLLQLDHDEIVAIAGGFVYEGEALPLLRGCYLFGGIATGRVLVARVRGDEQVKAEAVGLELGGSIVTLPSLVGNDRGDLRIGMGPGGEPYLLSKTNGMIWKIVGVRKR